MFLFLETNGRQQNPRDRQSNSRLSSTKYFGAIFRTILLLRLTLRTTLINYDQLLRVRRRKRFDIHLLTKINDMTRRFEVIMTLFSSDKRNGSVQV